MSVRNLKKGDEVVVISGKNKNRRGRIQRVLPEIEAVIVEGLNFAKKQAKPTKTNPQGGGIDKTLPPRTSKVKGVCFGWN